MNYATTSLRSAQRDDDRGRLRSHWTRLPGGGRVHARIAAGAAPPGRIPVVLVHGLGMSSHYLRPLMERLAPDFPVYAPDQPGFGSSFKPARVLDLSGLADFLAEWMDAVGLRRAALFGNSFGCQIGVEFALRHPERLDRLVLQGPTVDPRARSGTRQSLRWLVNARREGASFRTLIREYRRAGLGRVARTGRYQLADRIEDKLPRVAAPTLVVRGSRDPIVSQPWAERIADLLPRGRLAVVPGAAHTMNHYWDRELARVMRPFLLDEAGDDDGDDRTAAARDGP